MPLDVRLVPQVVQATITGLSTVPHFFLFKQHLLYLQAYSFILLKKLPLFTPCP